VVVVETMFSYDGIAAHSSPLCRTGNLPVLQAIVLVLGLFYVIVNIATDVATVLVTRGSARQVGDR